MIRTPFPPVRTECENGWKLPHLELADKALETRTAELIALRFRNFDAFHVASAELSGAEAFATCDDRLLALARRHAALLKVRVFNPVELAAEIFS